MTRENDRSQDLSFIRPNKLSIAISAVLAAPAGIAVAQDQEQEQQAEGFLEEVLVTATKRTANIQDIPASIQAISEAQIKRSGLYSLDDYIRFIPSMSYVSSNPGSAKIIFRGIADDAATFIAEPSASLYLDEQSLTLNATPDPRMVDIERIEALAGPQGTLYGASSQSGTLRIVTNKPDPTAFDANINLTFKGMSEGDSSYDVSAMLNQPVSDTFAIRLVGFTARDGGFIDNVFGKHPRFGDDSISDNAAVVQDDFNEVRHSGGRITGRWFVGDDWTVTAGYIYQKTESDGRPEMDQTLGDLKVVRFRPDKEYDNQDWSQFALTIEGDLGFADFVSATSYFERDWEYTQDTTAYAAYFGTFCYNPDFGPYNWIAYTRYCFQPADQFVYYNEPIGYLQNTQHNTKFAQEFRLSGQTSKLDWVAGLFWEESKEQWDFTTYSAGYSNSLSAASYAAGNLIGRGNPIPTVPFGDAWWFSADRTVWEQKAVFGEVNIHINDRWDATVGARWFDRTMDKEYHVELPQFNLTDEGFSHPVGDDSDVVPKISLKYSVDDNKMVYALYSEGFRAGGTNRNRGIPFFPSNYDSDFIENIEFGTKLVLAEGKVRLNATYFDMSWNNYQLEVVDPSSLSCNNPVAPPPPACGQPWQKVVANVGNASSKGLEVQLDVIANENFTWGANATWLDAVLDEDVNVTIPVPAGSRLPLSPEFKGSFYAQYAWPVDWLGSSDAYVRLQWSHTSDMLNVFEPLVLFDDGPAPQFTMPAYSIGDIRFGLNADDWSLQLFVSNLTDERAVLFDNPFEFDYFFGHGRQTVNRPREYGIRYSRSFSK